MDYRPTTRRRDEADEPDLKQHKEVCERSYELELGSSRRLPKVITSNKESSLDEPQWKFTKEQVDRGVTFRRKFKKAQGNADTNLERTTVPNVSEEPKLKFTEKEKYLGLPLHPCARDNAPEKPTSSLEDLTANEPVRKLTEADFKFVTVRRNRRDPVYSWDSPDGLDSNSQKISSATSQVLGWSELTSTNLEQHNNLFEPTAMMGSVQSTSSEKDRSSYSVGLLDEELHVPLVATDLWKGDNFWMNNDQSPVHVDSDNENNSLIMGIRDIDLQDQSVFIEKDLHTVKSTNYYLIDSSPDKDNSSEDEAKDMSNHTDMEISDLELDCDGDTPNTSYGAEYVNIEEYSNKEESFSSIDNNVCSLGRISDLTITSSSSDREDAGTPEHNERIHEDKKKVTHDDQGKYVYKKTYDEWYQEKCKLIAKQKADEKAKQEKKAKETKAKAEFAIEDQKRNYEAWLRIKNLEHREKRRIEKEAEEAKAMIKTSTKKLNRYTPKAKRELKAMESVKKRRDKMLQGEPQREALKNLEESPPKKNQISFESWMEKNQNTRKPPPRGAIPTTPDESPRNATIRKIKKPWMGPLDSAEEDFHSQPGPSRKQP